MLVHVRASHKTEQRRRYCDQATVGRPKNRGLIPGRCKVQEQSGRGAKLITHLHVVPGVEMSGAIHPPAHTPS